jgi:hypothetical protein
VGGNTRKGGQLFYVREEIADEGKNHRDLILAGSEGCRFALGLGRAGLSLPFP